jgi:hypothetical protein
MAMSPDIWISKEAVTRYNEERRWNSNRFVEIKGVTSANLIRNEI